MSYWYKIKIKNVCQIINREHINMFIHTYMIHQVQAHEGGGYLPFLYLLITYQQRKN